jgi:hypothetical protein
MTDFYEQRIIPKPLPSDRTVVLPAALPVLQVAVCFGTALDPSIFYVNTFLLNRHKGLSTEAASG